MAEVPESMRQIRSLVTAAGEVRVELAEVPVPRPGPDEVLIRVQATPVNPSDLGTLFAAADLGAARREGTDRYPVVVAPVSGPAAAARVGQSLPVGNEGAGLVVAAGSSEAAQALMGRTVAGLGGAMYAEYRCLPVASCLVLTDGTDPRDAASCFVNPLTALGMVETMRREGHHGLVHTAAASNLGQMLNRICLADGVPLVNVVRRPDQAELLRGQGATLVCDTSSPRFDDELTAALQASGATIAFDAIGGGSLAGRILAAMEAAVLAGQAGAYNRYGSAVHKQVYLYGNLDRGRTELERTFGMAWGIGGWLLTNFLTAVGPEVAAGLRRRVVEELHSTFASSYTKELALDALLDLDEIAVYSRQATGQKVLVRP